MARGSHYGKLEIGREVMNSLTKVSKDTLVIEVNELDTTRPESDKREDSAPQTPQCRGGEKIAMTVLATAYKNPPLVFDTYDCDKRPKEEPQVGEITPPTMTPTILATDYKSPPLVIGACVMPAPKR